MSGIGQFFVANPVISIFICLGLGYILGRVKFGSFTLGATVGVLVVSLIFGQIGVFTRDTVLGDIFFDFFMFAIGYRVGPTFVSSMKRFGMKIIISSFLFLIFAFLTAWACFKIFNVGPGVAAGTIAGALTQSAVIGSSLETIQKLPISGSLKALYSSQIPIVYALTYVFGTIGVLIFLRDLAPKMLHINVKDQATKVAREMNFTSAVPSMTRIRTYDVLDNSTFVGKTLADIMNSLDATKVQLLGAVRNGSDLKDSDTLQANDVVTFAGYANDLSDTVTGTGLHEVVNDDTKKFSEKFFILGKNFTKDGIVALEKKGIFVNLMDPAEGNMRTMDELHAGSPIGLTGDFAAVKSELSSLGKWKASANAINYAMFCLGIAASAALGVVGTKVGGVPLALGGGTGSVIVGLILSIWQDKNQSVDSIPDNIMEFFQSFGLNIFIVTVGLSAARTFVSAFKSLGISVFLIGAIISILPHVITLYIDKWVLKMEPVALIGSLTGADTLSAGLNAITEAAGPEGGPYFAATVAPAYVIGNIFLTLMGPIFLVLLAK
ncbi:TrkA C-terminal domain-containing protein [Lentilactobacillus senioris]|uniref:aspartate-alanine antiporter-like transporter n=1 Tax=Lentilactobacillus senioris TaxID=931534 RepID=UPI003D29B24F